MMDTFVSDLCQVWTKLGLELKPAIGNECQQGNEGFCSFCKKPNLFDALEARIRHCDKVDCPQLFASPA